MDPGSGPGVRRRPAATLGNASDRAEIGLGVALVGSLEREATAISEPFRSRLVATCSGLQARHMALGALSVNRLLLVTHASPTPAFPPILFLTGLDKVRP